MFTGLLVAELLIYCIKYLAEQTLVIYLQIYKSVLITCPTSFDIAFTNVEDTLKQRRDKVLSTLFQHRTPTLYQRCAKLKIRRRILFHFQRRIKVISSNVEMLAGYILNHQH